jgi:voltage-gated potassium channel
LWWSVVTATTVGYGDVSPVTPEGKFIAVGLMLLGIGFVGVFTATISSEFFDHGRVNQVEERLARIEAKLDRLHADALRLSLPEAINVKE